MGSVAYGVNKDNSDFDVYGFAIPRKEIVFPHLQGYIPGFGTGPEKFEQFEQHHVNDREEGRVYDFNVMSIVKYIDLCMDCNPNMIDSLFTPERCVLISSPASLLVRDNRKLFLSKRSWHTFKGYAFQQLRKMQTKKPEGKRLEIVEKYGYDVKFAYHLVRLLNEVQQILEEGDLDLERSREELKAIREGLWTQERVIQHFEDRSRQLEEVYHKSTIPIKPDEGKIKRVLLDCLEMEYTSLEECVATPDDRELALRDIRAIIERVSR